MMEEEWWHSDASVQISCFPVEMTHRKRCLLFISSFRVCQSPGLPEIEPSAFHEIEEHIDGDSWSLFPVLLRKYLHQGWASTQPWSDDMGEPNYQTLITLANYLMGHDDGSAEWWDQSGRITWVITELFGNPFRPVAFDPAWRTSTAIGVAQKMYDSRDFAAIPILADALQDAGCEDDAILAHCRGDGPHVRGCWVVDLVLGKQ